MNDFDAPGDLDHGATSLDDPDWDLLISDLHRESQHDGGEITDYFVNEFNEIAKLARPILDDVERIPGSRGA